MSNEISSIVLVENSEHLQKIQGQKLETRLKGKQVDLSWVDKIEDIPECTSSNRLQDWRLMKSWRCIHDRNGPRVL
jgi:SAM-dependent MidA family methyltransferase